MVKLSYFFSWFYIALSERVICNMNDELVVWTSMVRDITTKRYGRIANWIRVQLDSITSKWFEIVMNYHFSNLASQPPCQGLPKSCCRRKSNSTSSCLLLHCLCSSSVGGGVLVVCAMLINVIAYFFRCWIRSFRDACDWWVHFLKTSVRRNYINGARIHTQRKNHAYHRAAWRMLDIK